MAIETARALVKQDLEATDKYLVSELSHIPLINQMLDYIVKAGGKRIRPLLLLLSAKALRQNSAKAIKLAAVVELVHTATLLHDDVVDNSSLRRGRKTAKMIWGNEASILVGDFLYSRAFQMVVELENKAVLDIFAGATHYMTEGEILQLVHAHNPDTTQATYFDVIERKTAKLFAVATELGAVIEERDATAVSALRAYGLDLGLAYQLIDDALDYKDQTGKSMGNDLAEGKTTLPMIYAMEKGSAAQVKLLRQAIEAGASDQIPSLIEIIESTGAIEYTAQIAKQYAHKARAALVHLPSSPYREALHNMAEFTVDRSS